MQRRACENDISPNLPQLSTIQMQTLICSQSPWQRGVSVKGLLRLQCTPPIISPLQYGEIAIGLHRVRAQHGSCFIVFAGSRIQIPKVIKKKNSSTVCGDQGYLYEPEHVLFVVYANPSVYRVPGTMYTPCADAILISSTTCVHVSLRAQPRQQQQQRQPGIRRPIPRAA